MKKRILIVDNDQDILDVTQVLLLDEKHEVFVAKNYKQLMFVLENYTPDVMILDVMLETADGRIICKELKSDPRYKQIKIILFSASANKLLDYQQYKADAVLEKPFDFKSLIDVI